MPLADLESRIRDGLIAAARPGGRTKDEVRASMLARKLDELRVHRADLKVLESRAVSLLSKPDFNRLRPRLVLCAKADRPLFNYYRRVLSSAPFGGRPFRSLSFFCVDDNSGGVLGVVDLCSDLNSLGPRDRYIGWDRKQKYRALSYLANVGTCICSQPFGLLTGTKFQIVAVRSMFDPWEHRYQQPLAALVTTSLFGRASGYNRLTEWEYLGDTPGTGIFHVTPELWLLIHQYRKATGLLSRTSGRGGPGSRSDLLNKVRVRLGVKESETGSGQPRGIYFSPLTTNVREFLRGEQPIGARCVEPQDKVRDWWLERWYAMRLPKVNLAIDWSEYQIDRQIDSCVRSAANGTAAPTAGGRCNSGPDAPLFTAPVAAPSA